MNAAEGHLVVCLPLDHEPFLAGRGCSELGATATTTGGLRLAQPIPQPVNPTTNGEVIRQDVLGGIIHKYQTAACTRSSHLPNKAKLFPSDPHYVAVVGNSRARRR